MLKQQHAKKAVDFLPIEGIDHVEFYVGNAYQAAHYYRNMFGFDIVGHRGLETGDKEKASYVLRQGKVSFVLTPHSSGSPGSAY